MFFHYRYQNWLTLYLKSNAQRTNVKSPFHKCKYGNEDTMRIKDGCTIMHLVAEENMAMLASTMIFRFPRLLNQGKARTFDKNRRLPVELALDKQNNSDNVAAIMIKNMNSER